MRRVAIIGGNGSGKTTFARQLAQRNGLPLVHLDRLYWAEEWKPRAADEFDRLLAAELEKTMWIIDVYKRQVRRPAVDPGRNDGHP